MNIFQKIVAELVLGFCLIQILGAQEVDPLGIQNTPVRVIDFRKHGNNIEAFRAAGVEVIAEWKYYGQQQPKMGEENTDKYVARAGRYDILLPNNIRVRQDAHKIEIRLKREGRSYKTPVTDQILGLTVLPSKYATLNEVRALANSFSSQGGIARKGFWKWIESRKQKGYVGDASIGIPEGMNPRVGFSLRSTFDDGAKYAAIVDINIGWKDHPNTASEGFVMDWDVPAIMECVPKPEGLHPLNAYVGIVDVEKLWELGMPMPKTMTAEEWRKKHRDGTTHSDLEKMSPKAITKGQQTSFLHKNNSEYTKRQSPLIWIIAGVTAVVILLLYLTIYKGKS